MALTVTDVAERWNCSKNTVYRLIRENKLKTFRLGIDIRITEREVERFEDEGGCADE